MGGWRCFFIIGLMIGLVGCQSDLYSGLQEREANEIVSLLRDAQIDARRVKQDDGTITVTVPDESFSPAVKILDAHAYPRRRHTSMGEVFDGSGLVNSPTEERARMVYAVSEELSRTLMEIEGVLSARTHLVLPKSGRRSTPGAPSTASVFIKYNDEYDLEAMRHRVRLLVARSIEGLEYESVAVLLFPTAVGVDTSLASVSESEASTFNQVLWIVAAIGLVALIGGAAGILFIRDRRRRLREDASEGASADEVSAGETAGSAREREPREARAVTDEAAAVQTDTPITVMRPAPQTLPGLRLVAAAAAE
ncbi:MAG: type III secretion inner membrane ring lipoprotein SctJ [Pseudomonadota bacterium]